MVLKGMSSLAGEGTILVYPTMNMCISSRTWSKLRESASCGICRVSFHRHWEGGVVSHMTVGGSWSMCTFMIMSVVLVAVPSE